MLGELWRWIEDKGVLSKSLELLLGGIWGVVLFGGGRGKVQRAAAPLKRHRSIVHRRKSILDSLSTKESITKRKSNNSKEMQAPFRRRDEEAGKSQWRVVAEPAEGAGAGSVGEEGAQQPK